MEKWMKNLGVTMAVGATTVSFYLAVVGRDELMADEINQIKLEKAVETANTRKDIEILKKDMNEVKDNVSAVEKRVSGIESTVNSINYKIDIIIDSQKRINELEHNFDKMEKEYNKKE